MTYDPRNIHAPYDTFKQWPRGNIIVMYMSIMVLVKKLWICVVNIINKIKKTKSESSLRDSAIIEMSHMHT